MKIKKNFKALSIALLIILTAGTISYAQVLKLQSPRQEKLLNGLKVLIWSTDGSDKVSVKLRIHRGSAFDPRDKEGTMSLLGNMLFPNQASREFFEQDLGGSLDIATNYDFIQYTITANSDKVLEVLETLANAISNAQIDKDSIELVRKPQVDQVIKLLNSPAYSADKAVAERLFGDFPYGRPELGTLESLKKIDFADILFARKKFLTSDAATLAIVGNVKSDLVYRAVRRYFGGWIKADSDIPATFRLPETPEKSLKILEASQANTSELRIAFRGVARNDKNYYASEIIESILTSRIQGRERGKVSVSSKAHLLPGSVTISIKDWNLGFVKRDGNKMALPADLDESVAKYFSEPIKISEFDAAKADVLKRFNADSLSEFWLDIDTFKLASFAKDYQAAQNVTLEDVKALAEKFKNTPSASVLLFQNPTPELTPQSADQD
jgi:zinc protease